MIRSRVSESYPYAEEQPANPERSLRVALLYNLASNAPEPPPDAPHDYLYELDHEHNVEAYRLALESRGHRVFPMEGDADLPARLRSTPVDICFNTCEGFRGDAREAQAPALLEMIGARYTGSNVRTLALTLDKPMTKRVLAFYGLPTPAFQEFQSIDDPLDPRLHFPLFAKPACEGTGIGIDAGSILRTEAEVRDRVASLIEAYRQPALVEEYVDGTDVTVGLVGNWPDLHIFPISRVDYSGYGDDAAPIYSAEYKVDRADDYRCQCPAELPEALAEELRRLAVATVRATNTFDFARVDFRLDRSAGERPTILEINSLPGITPISDLTLMAQAEGWSHADLINAVLDAALRRHGFIHALMAQEERTHTWTPAPMTTRC
jgi:D-alanine-D-alanine ligase